ncbi:hypothetical protein [uncultured Duncaniella sp.]|uniref:hypothetical protein n=1 Tax=uncultured Duncaniella sp. TaxID=2768039 RepID=UPI0025AEDF44|nr:hypothetical protein [uncultured Duncaniella sp.]
MGGAQPLQTLRCWERSDGYLGLPDNLQIVVSFGCYPKNIGRLFPSFHDFLMRQCISFHS